MFRKLATALALVLVTAVSAAAQPPAASNAEPVKLELERHNGTIALPSAHAVLSTGDKYDFVDASDAKKVLVDAWGNPPESVENVLGMMFLKGADPLAEGVWGIVVEYADMGFVTDSDARTADYTKVLNDMRKDEEDVNRERERQHYPTIHLAGWAAPPSYDAQTHVVTWAKDVQFGADPEHTLNYDIRVLGRRGVLVLQVISSMADLPQVQAAADSIRQTAVFDDGSRYADHASSDKMAGIGIAGLIAGGVGVAVAKKAGLIAILILVFKKGAVFIIAGSAAIGAYFRKMFGLKPKRPKITNQIVEPGDGAPPPSDDEANRR